MKEVIGLLKPSFFESIVWRKKILPTAIALIGALALLLLVLLSIASSNTEFFDRYFIWLYAANIVIGVCLTIVILTLVIVIAVRWHRGYRRRRSRPAVHCHSTTCLGRR